MVLMATGIIFNSSSDSKGGSASGGAPEDSSSETPNPGLQQETKQEAAKDAEKNKQQFEKAVEQSKQPLFRLSTVFPFVLFQDHINIDPNKVTVVLNFFFRTQRIHSIYIADITDVYVETSLFFAALSIVDRGFIENEIKVKFLPRALAIKARRIIQGLVVAKKTGVDITQLDGTPDLIKKLEELGEAHSPEKTPVLKPQSAFS